MADLPSRGLNDSGHIADHNTMHALVEEMETAFTPIKSSQITALTEETNPADADLLWLEKNGTGAYRKPQIQNLPSTGGGGGGGLEVTWVNTSPYTITAEGIFMVDSSSSVMVVNLPNLTAVGSTGFRVVVKRIGANYVDLDCDGSDEFEPGSITSKRLFNDGSAVNVIGHGSGTYWYEFGFYGGILPS